MTPIYVFKKVLNNCKGYSPYKWIGRESLLIVY